MAYDLGLAPIPGSTLWQSGTRATTDGPREANTFKLYQMEVGLTPAYRAERSVRTDVPGRRKKNLAVVTIGRPFLQIM